MQIERISALSPISHDAVEVFAALHRGRRQRQATHVSGDQSVNPRLPRITEEHHDTAAQFIPAAIDWLEANRGLICSPADFRITTDTPPKAAGNARHPSSPSPLTMPGGASIAFCHAPLLWLGLRLPIGPAIGLTAVTIGGIRKEGWRLKSGIVLAPAAGVPLPPGVPFTVEVLVGFQKLPHLVHLAISLMCHHWLKNPANFESRSLGEDIHAVDQFLHFHAPKQGGLAWL